MSRSAPCWTESQWRQRSRVHTAHGEKPLRGKLQQDTSYPSLPSHALWFPRHYVLTGLAVYWEKSSTSSTCFCSAAPLRKAGRDSSISRYLSRSERYCSIAWPQRDNTVTQACSLTNQRQQRRKIDSLSGINTSLTPYKRMIPLT